MPPTTKKAPLPTSITVRNFFPPLAITPTAEDTIPSPLGSSDRESQVAFDSGQNDHDALPSRVASPMASSSFSNNRYDHLRGRLMKLRLDIVLKRSNAECGENAAFANNTTTTICTLPNQAGGSAHPRWDHLNEHINQEIISHNDDWEKDIYLLLFARFVIVDQKTNNRPSSSSHEESLLAEIPLHPSHLRTLPFTSDASATFATIQIPHSLTPNSVLIHYDDGCTRVLPSLYGLLIHKNVIEQCTDSLLTNQVHAEDGSARFNERAFDFLGDGSEENSSLRRDGETSTESNSIYDDKVFDLLGDETSVIRVNFSKDACSQTQIKKNNHNPSIAHEEVHNYSQSVSVSSYHEDAFHHPKEPTMIYQESSVPENDASEIYNSLTGSSSREQLMCPGPSSAQLDELHISQRLSTELGSSGFSPKKEVAELRRQVQLERERLKREQMWMNKEAENLRLIIQQVQQLQRETTDLMNHVDTERGNLFRTRVCLEAHRAHLLKHLKLIFPIKIVLVDPRGGVAISSPFRHEFTIAGIPLPVDIHSTSISDDQVSTALGFTCHLITLTSKYLDVALRHKIVCKYSRSAIIDEGGGGRLNSIQGKVTAVVYPLFRERGVVDREQLDHGLMLLTRNVDSLLRIKQLQFHEDWNILVKLDRLYSSIIDGKQPSFVAD